MDYIETSPQPIDSVVKDVDNDSLNNVVYFYPKRIITEYELAKTIEEDISKESEDIIS